MKRFWQPWGIILLILALAGLAAVVGPGATQGRHDRPEGKDKTLSPYFVVLTGDPEKDLLPLKSTRADVKIAGTVAAVQVTQVYQNQGKKPLEAVYVFPGSTRAAVHAMRMTIGERIIEAQIMEREKARKTYEDAKKEGKTTSLLEQQRPNVFQMNVANILPGEEVKVELNYLELLEPEENVYEFVFPAMVGPRYSNMAAAGAPDTEKWVKNPYLHEGQPPPYTFGLSVELKSALPISRLASPSHDIEVKYAGPEAAAITLKDEKTGGNKDFALRYTLAGDKIQGGLLLFPGKDENFFLMMMEPPAQVAQDAVVKREYLFIVDVSGSMHGFPLDVTKTLMEKIINDLKPHEFFNVLLFESNNAVLSESGSLPATEENKQKALGFIKEQRGGGGTEILAALNRALALPRTPGTSRIVVVATDGYVHVEPQTFELIREKLGEANLFAFGIGKSVNRHLIEGMARVGQGEPFIVLTPQEAVKEAARFQKYIQSPVLTGIKVAFEGFDAYDVEPLALPDLFSLRPLSLLGKYRGPAAGNIAVSGKTAQGDFQQKIQAAPGQASADNAALRLLWARKRIMRLGDSSHLKRSKDEAAIKEITQLGLKYSLMTAYTSFVAVDQVKRADGQVVTVKQPLPLPEGVSDLAVGGSAPGAGYRMGMPMTSMARPAGPLAFKKELDPTSVAPAPGKAGAKATPGLTVAVQVVGIKGRMDKAALNQVLADAAPTLAACCEDARRRGVKLAKEITLVFTLGTDGRVAGEILPKPPLASEALTKCLSQAVRGIGFPRPATPIVVTVRLGLKEK
jgi:Ca-activated chloride channel family protein